MSARSSLRTPLGKVRGHGPAHAGTAHFWRQRLTGLANVPLTFAFVLVVASLAGSSHAEAAALLGSFPVALLMGLFLIVGLYHMKLGMQVVIEDYVHHEGWKLAALVANIFFVVLIGAAAGYALLTIGFTDMLAKG
jgi:succinate dehydrogenase / fumarate reductase membrane anchor subunit